MKKKINESTGTPGSPGTKGYTGYLPSEKYAKYRSDLARIIKKTTGYDLVDLEPITDDTIDVKDNETNDDDISDVNISSPKRHQQLQKDFKKMNESIGRKVTVKEVVKWMKKLEEYRYRKVKSVDARRVASFINNGLSETDLPTFFTERIKHSAIDSFSVSSELDETTGTTLTNSPCSNSDSMALNTFRKSSKTGSVHCSPVRLFDLNSNS